MSENLPAKTKPVPLAKIKGPVGGWDTMADILAEKAPEMERIVNAALSPDKLVALALTAMKSSKAASKIVNCTGLSVAKAIMDLATTGLSPAPQLGQCCFVPYGPELQLQIEYRGFIALAKRSGEVSYITADVVRDGDDIAFERGTNQFLRHVPRGVGKATHYYAVVRFKDGATDFRIMTVEQVEKHRDKFSKQFNSTKDYKGGPKGPWAEHFDAMAMKTCIRQLCKFLSLSPELTAATIVDEYNEAGVGMGRSLDMNSPGRSGFDLSPKHVDCDTVPPDEAKDAQGESQPPPRDSDAPVPASDDEGLGPDAAIPEHP